MSLRVVIDSRHINDFGVGTYIRNLTMGLAKIDQENHYILITHRDDIQQFAGLPLNFETASYDRPDSMARDNVSFPMFLRRFSADIYPHPDLPGASTDAEAIRGHGP